MVKVVATSKGYFGGIVRELGEGFTIPDEIWDDQKRRPSWAILDKAAAASAVAGVQESDKGGDGNPVAAAGKKAIEVPADWSSMHGSKRKQLAKAITGEAVGDLATADNIIAAYVDANKPAPFDDAPAPQTVASALKEVGGVQPDWEAPGAPQPVAD